MRARQVLDDCRKAHSLLEHEDDPQTFRILFVAAVTLCRAVGHVLDKVDAKEDPRLKESVQSWWRELNSDTTKNTIFHNFIDQQRNNILKEYDFAHDDHEQKLMVLPSMELFSLGELLFCPIEEGEYAGEDCRDILHDAILWWDEQLKKLEWQSKVETTPNGTTTPLVCGNVGMRVMKDWNQASIACAHSKGGVTVTAHPFDNLIRNGCSPWPPPEIVQKLYQSRQIRAFTGETGVVF